ncbi:MAG: CocE/NonD family hydrolase [Actinomycetota bacterium]
MRGTGGKARWVVAVVAVALAASGGIGARWAPGAVAGVSDGQAPGGRGPNTWTRQELSVEVMTGPGNDLKVTIAADLYVPSSATAATPAPAILTQPGFGGTKEDGAQLANSAFFASHGYVVLSYDPQGFGGSSSCIGLNSADYDAKNAMHLIDLLAARKDVAKEAPGDPKVGIVGGSYGGGGQGVIAAMDPRVDAIAIGRAWNTLQYSLVPNNWIADPAKPWDLAGYEQGVFKQEWTSLFVGLGATQPAMGNGGCDPVTQQTEFPGQAPCPGFTPAICPTYARLTSTGDAEAGDRDLVSRSSVATYTGKLNAPTLLVQGLPDTLFNVNEAVATYKALRHRGVPSAVIWNPGGHGGFTTDRGTAEAYGGSWDDTPAKQAEFSRGYLPRRTLQWFERYVRGQAVDTGPAFAWFRDWVNVDLAATGGSAAPAYGMSGDFPVAAAPAVTYNLDPGAGALVAGGGAVTGGGAMLLVPAGGEPAAYSETANFSSPGGPGDRPPTEIEGQFAQLDTPAFKADTEMAGVPVAHLRLSHVAPTGDIRFFLKLYDVDTNGGATLLRRQVAAARVPDSALSKGAVDVRLVGASHLIRAGHAMRLVVATTDQAYYNARVADAITLSSSAAQPSTIELPLRPLGAGDPKPAPAPSPQVLASKPRGGLPATGGGLAPLGFVVIAGALWLRRRRSPNRRAEQEG